MPEVQLKNKLVTLEDIGEALGSDIIVKGVKGNNENDYRGGDVNLTPANIGAVDKTGDTMTGSLQLSNEQPLIWPITGGYKWEIYPEEGNGLQFTLLNAGGVAVQTFSVTEDGTLQLPSPLGVLYGGTGTNTVAGAISALFDITMDQSRVYAYPNAPGVYQVGGDNIFQHLSPASPYGTLIIIGRVYAAHFYIDSSSSLYVGHSGETFGEPTTWRTCT